MDQRLHFTQQQTWVATKLTQRQHYNADTGGDGSAIVEGTIRKVARAINSLIFEVKSDGDVMIAICDNSQQDAASIKSKVDDAIGVTNTTVTKLTTLLGLA